MSIKVDIISGFLGAGKTTLIKKLFETGFHDEKVVLIENEFGEIGIDGSFLKESGVNIKEINSGCICCSLVGDFSASMSEVISTYQPERIIIEPSGVGKLSDIVKAVEKLDLDLELNIVATVVDGGKCKVYMKNFGEFFNNQVSDAHIVVMSKVERLSNEKVVEAYELIKEKNSNCNVILADLNAVDPHKLLEALERTISYQSEVEEEFTHGCCCRHHEGEKHEHECCHHHEGEEHEHECCHHHEGEHHHHDADEVFVSVGYETPMAYSKNELTKILEALKEEEKYGVVLRAKGILKASDQEKWHYFDYVAGDYSIREGEADFVGRIVVIGSQLKKENIETLVLKK
ncbi:MAG: GTP-binding protein [Anaeroplasma bactoclasticum]|nr:GTP-binding protein [Anaeroplasma bactoclasticum]